MSYQGTKNFKPSEMSRGAREVKSVLYPAAAYPARWIDSRLPPLFATIQTIREAMGEAIVITSGYRDPAFNVAIGGARFSQHMEGRATDLMTSVARKLPKGDPKRAADAKRMHALVLSLYNAGSLPHLGGLGQYPEFVHVDTRETKRLVRWGGSRDDG